MEQPKIGIWICDCKGLISDNLDTALIQNKAKELENVTFIKKVDTLCGKKDMQILENDIKENNVERILFGGCSARTSLKFPEGQITGAMKKCGIDKAYFEAANLREQCAWMHKNKNEATKKGIDIVRMAHARIISAETSLNPAVINQKALVIGGGPAGIHTAKSLAEAGLKVTVVEKGTYLGGHMCQLNAIFQCEGWPGSCRSDCVGPAQAKDVVLNSNIEVLFQSEVMSVEKSDGNFQVRIKKGSYYVDYDNCIACKKCAEVCPEETYSKHNRGFYKRKAIDKDFERAVPESYMIIDEACTKCGDCVPVCPTNAINLEAKPDILDKTYGAVFLATGLEQLDLNKIDKFNFGASKVISGLDLERITAHNITDIFEGEEPERIVFKLCAGSRDKKDQNGVSYCSKTCCGIAVKQAEKIIASNPMVEVIILYKDDIRTYERALEAFYTNLKGIGVEFINGDIDSVEENDDGSLKLNLSIKECEDPDLEDCEYNNGKLTMRSDLLVLSAAQTPPAQTASLIKQLGVQTDIHGFPIENQIRLFKPSESLVDRVYAVGASSGPKIVQQSVEQGRAAAMKALPLLMKGEKEIGKFVSIIKDSKCIKCQSCITVCPHGAIKMTQTEAVSDPAFCQACGFCAAACPTHAAQLVNFTDKQILDQAAVAFNELDSDEPKVLALLCYWCSYGGGDMAGIKGMEVPSNFRSIRIRCSSSVNSGLIMEMFKMGIDGILVAGCPDKNCHHAWGNYLSSRRIDLMRRFFNEIGLNENRLRFEYIGVPESQKLIDTLLKMNKELTELGSNPIPTLTRS